MQIYNEIKINTIPFKQRKSDSVNDIQNTSSTIKDEYRPVPTELAKAYASPQIMNNYKEIQAFKLPFIGEGKLYELKNGHKVAIIKRPGVFVINTFVKTGTEQSPIKHMVEHLIYNSQNLSQGKTFTEHLLNEGAYQQAVSAGNYTNFRLNCPITNQDSVKNLIKLQADMLQHFTIDNYEKEKNVLKAEYIMNPTRQINCDINKVNTFSLNQMLNLALKSNVYNDEVSNIDRMTKQDIINHYSRFYNNNNMITIIESNCNPQDVIKVVSKSFNKKNLYQAPSFDLKYAQHSRNYIEPIEISVESDIPNNLQLNFVGPQISDTKSNLLFLMLKKYLKTIMPNVSLNKISAYPYTSETMIQIASTSHIDEINALKNLQNRVEQLLKLDITEEEFETLKFQLKNDYSRWFESSSILTELCAYKLLQDQSINFEQEYQQLDKLNRDDLNQFINKYIDLNNSLKIIAHNQNPTSNVSFMGSKTVENNIENLQYNNMKVLIDKSKGITRTTYQLGVNINTLPHCKPGVLEIIVNMLQDRIINNLPKSIQSDIKFQVDANEIKCTLSSPPESTLNVINYINNSIQYPNFSIKNFNEQKKLLKTFNKFIIDDNITKFYQEKYPNNKFYDLKRIASKDERIKLIDDIQFEDVINTYNTLLQKSNLKAILVVPNSIYNTQKLSILQEIKDIARNCNTDSPNYNEKRNKVIYNENKVIYNEIDDINSSVYLDFKIPKPNSIKEQLAIEIISIILGHSPIAKLDKKFRQESALTYAQDAIYDSNNEYFELGVNIPLDKSNAKNLQKIINQLYQIINNINEYGITVDELNNSKKYLKGKIQSTTEFSEGRCELLDEFGCDSESLMEIIDQITLEDIGKISNKYFSKPSLLILNTNNNVFDANQDYIKTRGNLI